MSFAWLIKLVNFVSNIFNTSKSALMLFTTLTLKEIILKSNVKCVDINYISNKNKNKNIIVGLWIVNQVINDCCEKIEK